MQRGCTRLLIGNKSGRPDGLLSRILQPYFGELPFHALG